METQFRKWLSEMTTDLSHGDDRRVAVSKALQTLYNAAWLSISSRRPLGTNVFAQQWDALIILDACRVDALREVASEYEFLSSVDSGWSVGSATLEWIVKTFSPKYRSELQRTAYISPNPFIGTALIDHEYPPFNDTLPFDWSKWEVVDGSTFKTLEVIWQEGYDDPLGFPHPVVKRVPWAVTRASDEETRSPDITVENTRSISKEEHFRDLGYL